MQGHEVHALLGLHFHFGKQFLGIDGRRVAILVNAALRHRIERHGSKREEGCVQHFPARRMATRSPAMERSITVSAPASRATASLRISQAGWFWNGEVPILAFTLTLAGCPTSTARRPGARGCRATPCFPLQWRRQSRRRTGPPAGSAWANVFSARCGGRNSERGWTQNISLGRLGSALITRKTSKNFSDP